MKGRRTALALPPLVGPPRSPLAGLPARLRRRLLLAARLDRLVDLLRSFRAIPAPFAGARIRPNARGA
eukprot:914307-Pyramimonas_sp.AAC.1